MVKKTKCDPSEMLMWNRVASITRTLEPNPEKVTLAIQKRAVQQAIDGGFCIPKPKGGGGGEAMKSLGTYYRAVQKKTGKLYKTLY